MKLDHIVILVSDLEKSLAFYNELLTMIGFNKARDHAYGNTDGVHIDIRQAKDLDHEYRRYAPGLNHIGFTALDRDAIVDIQKSMNSAGYEAPPIQSFDDGVALFLKDPDGMRIEVSVYES